MYRFLECDRVPYNKKVIVSFPVSRLGMYSTEALPLVKPLEAEPPRIGFQPGGWEPVGIIRKLIFLSVHFNGLELLAREFIPWRDRVLFYFKLTPNNLQ
jgi:hypothetical protein